MLGAIPLVLIITWRLAISPTNELRKELAKLERSIAMYDNPEMILAGLNQQLVTIQEDQVADPSELDENLLDIISNNIGRFRLRLEEFPETHSYSSENFVVKTFRLRFSGRFTDLLRFINFAEYEIGTCNIVSVDLERELIRKVGEKLFADIYFQTVYKNQEQR